MSENTRQKKYIKHVMLDLETLGLKPGCSILSIGAVVMATNIPGMAQQLAGDTFYAKLSRESCRNHGLIESAETLAWWNQQSREAYDEVMNTPHDVKYWITSVLLQYKKWLGGHYPEDTRVITWCCGADFDMPILRAAYEATGIEHFPAHYGDTRCYRTVRDTFPLPHPIEFEGIKHSALADALHQAKVLKAIMLSTGKTLIPLEEYPRGISDE